MSFINFMACASFFTCVSCCFHTSSFCPFCPLHVFVHHRLLYAFMTVSAWWLRQRICLHCGRSAFTSPVGKTPWRRKWTEEPGGLQFIGWQRVRHDWATNTFSFYTLKMPVLLGFNSDWNLPLHRAAKLPSWSLLSLMTSSVFVYSLPYCLTFDVAL